MKKKKGLKVFSVNPKHPAGDISINYDPDDDVLLIALVADGNDDEKSIAKSKMWIESERDVVITVNHLMGQPWFISSVALTHASRHPLWGDLFRGLEFALRECKTVKFTIDPSRWALK